MKIDGIDVEGIGVKYGNAFVYKSCVDHIMLINNHLIIVKKNMVQFMINHE